MESREITLLSIITVILILSISFPVENAFAITETKITASDAAAGDQFGRSVAISGNTAIVGAIRDDDGGNASGSAYIFDFDGGAWTQTAKLTASDAAAGDLFGGSVAISGNTVIVGSSGDNSNSGSAYIFEKPGTGWVDANEDAKLTASDAAKSDQFGFSVVISGDTAIVGAIGDDGVVGDSGTAYIFEKPGTGWVNANEDAKIIASDGAKDDQFGRSVAISGNTAIVGAIFADEVGSNSGSAYIFDFDGNDWTQTAKITASDAAAGDGFGGSIAISDNTVIVGSSGDNSNSGSAYIFDFDGNDWTQTAKINASDAAADDGFGGSIAISDNTVIVGSSDDDDGGSFSGSAYIFDFDGNDWTQTAKITASDAAADDRFGWSVAISGNTAIAGAILGGDGGTSSGSAYILDLPSPEPEPTSDSNGGDNQWDTRPTFGVSHETRQDQIVENGFSFNSEYFTLTDNHHTEFAEQSIGIGTVNSFSATVWADKGLKVQEFLFGIPTVGESHLAELGVEIWYDINGEIEDIIVVQKSDVIAADTVRVKYSELKLNPFSTIWS